MLDNSIDVLLESLQNITNECNKLICINESTTESTIDDKFSELAILLMDKVDKLCGLNPSYLTLELANKAIRVNTSISGFEVLSYPNINKTKRVDLQSNLVIDYVLDKINKSIHNSLIDFNSREVNEEAIAYALYKLTGISKYRSLDISKFKEEFKKYIFDDYKKCMVKPSTTMLSSAARYNLNELKYINKLSKDYIKNLYKYKNKLINHLKTKDDSNINHNLSKYILCLETAIKNLLTIYKDIYSVLAELDIEYRRIFKQVIDMDSILNESVDLQSSNSFLTTAIYELKHIKYSLNSNEVLSESVTYIIDPKQKESFKESLITTINKLTSMLNTSVLNEEKLDFIRNNQYIVSKLPQDTDIIWFTYDTINNEIPSDIENIIINIPDENISKEELLQSIFNNTELFKSLPNNDSIDDIIVNIKELILGKQFSTKTLNIELLANNLIQSQVLLTKINNKIKETKDSIIEVIRQISEQNNNSINSGINKIKKYCIYLMILDCVFGCLSEITVKTLEHLVNTY